MRRRGGKREERRSGDSFFVKRDAIVAIWCEEEIRGTEDEVMRRVQNENPS